MEGRLKIPAASPLAAAIVALGADEFADRLLDLVDGVSGADASMILHYWPDRAPQVLADRLDPAERPYLYGDYLAGLYRLSPFYRAASGLKAPVMVRLKDIAPEGFRQSEYYRNYFARIGVDDLAGILAPLAGNGTVHISFARKSDRPGFDRTTLRRLAEVVPVIAALVQRHWQGALSRTAKARSDSPLDALRGEFDLTRREVEIAEAVLAGHSSKSAARLLAISSETVKVHRKNLYAKLSIASQAELFALFLARLGR